MERYILKKKFYFSPTLIYDEIKERQLDSALILFDMFIKKIKNKKNYIKSIDQKEKPSYFKKFKSTASKIDITKTIKSQINIMRTRDNNNFPSYFYYKKRKFIIKLYS